MRTANMRYGCRHPNSPNGRMRQKIYAVCKTGRMSDDEYGLRDAFEFKRAYLLSVQASVWLITVWSSDFVS